jgi:hypothetical protein
VPGEQVELRFTVRNAGDQVARAPWTDRIFISSGTTLAGASQLAEVQRTFDLAPGATYEIVRTVTMPDLANGDYRFVIRTDANSQVFEAGLENDNIRASDGVVVMTSPDLRPVGGDRPQRAGAVRAAGAAQLDDQQCRHWPGDRPVDRHHLAVARRHGRRGRHQARRRGAGRRS